MQTSMLNTTQSDELSRTYSMTTSTKELSALQAAKQLLFVRTIDAEHSLSVGTMQLVTSHCILTAVAPLSKDSFLGN